MGDKLLNIKQIPYNYEEEKEELKYVLKQSRVINEIQAELASLIDIQDSDISHIQETIEETNDISLNATRQLEIASGRKFTIKPLAIGAVSLALLSLPISLAAGATGSVVGYIAGGSALAGGYFGKKLS